MNYESAVRYLLSLGRELAAPTQAAAAKFNLENITILLERLGRPDRAYPCVHVAGTNGKGSSAAFLEKILRDAGFRTGLNTSPHLERINERIRISGEEIADARFAEIFTRIHAVIEDSCNLDDLRNQLLKNGIAVAEIRPLAPSLEDVFVELTYKHQALLEASNA